MTLFVPIVVVQLVILFVLKGNKLGVSIVKAYLVLLLVMAVSTEILSVFGAVTYGALVALWIILAVALLAWVGSSVVRRRVPGVDQDTRAAVEAYGLQEAALLFAIGCIACMTLLVALVYPPNNWDSMTYHMSRVAQWIQRGSVEFYATSIDRQNYQPPLAEFAILHLQLLSGSDRFANIIQWYSFGVSIVVAGLLAKTFGVPPRGQVVAAVVAATIPMAILQSSSTQNDVVTAALCVSFAYFLLAFTQSHSVEDGAFSALSLGAALLTKATAYLFCCAIGLTIGIAALVSAPPRRRPVILAALTGIVVAGLALNAGHLSRNYRLYGHPLSTAPGYTNEELSGRIVLANVVRNGALHLDTPLRRVNSYGYAAMMRLLGDELNNPKSTMATTRVTIPRFTLHEDVAGNPIHFVLVSAALLVLPFAGTSRRAVYWCAGALLAAAALYSGVLKWQPWATRLHTPLFMLSAPLIAAVFAGNRPWQRYLGVGIAVVCLAYSVPFLVWNKTRPAAMLGSFVAGSGPWSREGRLKSYFVNRDLHEEYSAAATIIMAERAEEVGLCVGYDDYEYPLWVLVGREASRGTPRFRHVGVTDISRTMEPPAMPAPAIVVSTKRLDDEPVHGKGRSGVTGCLPQEYVPVFDATHIRVWKLKGR